MVAMITTKRRMEEAMPAKVVGLQGGKKRRYKTVLAFFSLPVPEVFLYYGQMQDLG